MWESWSTRNAIITQAAGKCFKALQAVLNIQKNYQNSIKTQGTCLVLLFEKCRIGKENHLDFSFFNHQKVNNLCLCPRYTSHQK